jgi:hypothetical protein
MHESEFGKRGVMEYAEKRRHAFSLTTNREWNEGGDFECSITCVCGE